MVTILKSGAGKRAIQSILKNLRERSPKKGLDAYKYCGTVKFKEDGLTLQKRWRDDWD